MESGEERAERKMESETGVECGKWNRGHSGPEGILRPH